MPGSPITREKFHFERPSASVPEDFISAKRLVLSFSSSALAKRSERLTPPGKSWRRLPSTVRRKEMSGRGRLFSMKTSRHIIVSDDGRFKKFRLAGKFSKRPSLMTIVPFPS